MARSELVHLPSRNPAFTLRDGCAPPLRSDLAVLAPLLFLTLALTLRPDTAVRAQEFPGITGWEPVTEVRTYFADNLWEYINGAAELFVSYDVLECRTRDVAADGIVVTVELYDMSSRLNAWGIFLRERPDEPAIPVAGATAAVLSLPWQGLLLKGTYYVKLNVVEGELTGTSGTALLTAVAAALPGSPELPPELAALPSTARESGSEGYQRVGFAGRPELRQCLFARYHLPPGGDFTGFVVVDTPEATGDEVFAGLDEGWEDLPFPVGTARVREIPYQGLVGVVRTPDGVFGAAEAPDRAALTARLELLTGRARAGDYR